MKAQFEDVDGSGKRLKLSGDLTIQEAGEFKAILAGSLETTDSLSINVESVTAAELPCLQLLCAAHKTSIRQAKTLALDGHWPEPFFGAVRESGFALRTGCNLQKKGRCIFLENTYE
jgi:hypothetical protein